jgi:hypothetical protein
MEANNLNCWDKGPEQGQKKKTPRLRLAGEGLLVKVPCGGSPTKVSCGGTSTKVSCGGPRTKVLDEGPSTKVP